MQQRDYIDCSDVIHAFGKNSNLNSSNSDNIFSEIKNTEMTIEWVFRTPLTKVVSKFRCTDHRLEIEIGRHNKLEVEQRTCQLCRGNVETEIHVLQECPLYAKLRRIYFNDDENMNLNYILQCRNKIVANKLANFLTEAFELRKRMLDLHAYFT